MYMKRKYAFLLILGVVFFVQHLFAQDRKLQMHAVAFYNLENLFDTCHDAGKNDWEFLPNGTNHWTKIKYEHKLANMARVLSELGSDKLPYGASIIGVSEVENSKALDDLIAQPKMQKRGFRYIHIEGPDKRGVDCALIYNPRAFKITKAFNKDYVYENGDTVRRTRPFFCVQGKLAGDNVTVIVCHWPSRAAEGIFREYGGRQVRALTDSISKADPSQHIIVMGDMNDDPDNASMAQCLGAKRKMSEVGEGDFYNPWWDILRKKGQGTLSYQGAWNLFDQIVVSRNLIEETKSKSYNGLTLQSYHIFKRDYLFNTEGAYKGTPKRTHSRGVWLNGYSDHLPVVVYLVKEQK
jgi:endonuclease/exonuclease/phosphatase family metal-dependent hydrolase